MTKLSGSRACGGCVSLSGWEIRVGVFLDVWKKSGIGETGCVYFDSCGFFAVQMDTVEWSMEKVY